MYICHFVLIASKSPSYRVFFGWVRYDLISFRIQFAVQFWDAVPKMIDFC